MYIYFDNSATTQVDPEVLEAMLPYFKEKYANPSSMHIPGREIGDDLESARESIARLINAKSHEIVFTASGSESNNMAIKGAAHALKGKGNHIITSKIEHKAVLEPFKFLEREGYDVTFLDVDEKGLIGMDTFKKAVRDDTILVSIMLANNEIGTIQPIRMIADYAKNRGIAVHTDAVQAVGKMRVDVQNLGVNLLTFSGHKFYAPKGIGALFIEEDLKEKIEPIVHGGSHEYGLRAGTENVPYIMGLKKACQLIEKNLDSEAERIGTLRDSFEEKILKEIPDTYVNGSRQNRVCNVSNITFKYVEGEALMAYASDICCSAGSACSSQSGDVSHVLKAIGTDPVDMHGAIRFSFGRFNAMYEVDTAVDLLRSSVEKLRKISPIYNTL